MARKNIAFPGRHGDLAGALELPATAPRGFALFAHCFTCGKDSLAAARISRLLAARGVAVLRFDFTGLGGSDGDFGNSHFSSNIEDLVAAADHLRKEYAAPALLIGHSLGGTAVLAAASRIEEARAVVTIGAPASPEHVIARFGASLEALDRGGAADVTLGGRSFRLDRSFVDDLREHSMHDRIHNLRKALLIMHSPIDATVDVEEASRIFQSAMHPKSFVSLDDADHLLRRAADAEFVASTIAGWADRYFADAPEAGHSVEQGKILVTERNDRFLRHVQSDDHDWLADEPARAGGDNLGPDPYEQLLAALGTCTSMTIRMYANRKKWPLDDVRIELSHERDHGKDCERCEEPGQVIDVIKRTLAVAGKLDDAQRSRLVEIADRCPVHKTLTGDLRIETRLEPD
ncbi:MAG TPA: alpha/beta fold hydrolase [Gammaproteobacteria bacterium]|nr:alpha/beta fold hydrolase [Gammaproteobacteria bacterium]